MSVVIFILILVVLIIVHELGHFLFAKKAGIRVDEFGLGYPPRIAGWKKGETTYTLNLLPFGGFVKIFGEDPNEESTSGPDSSRSFVNKPKWIQALVLAAGVIFNIIFAWLVISAGYMTGMPTPANNDVGEVSDARTTIIAVRPGAPAALSGMKPGDRIISVSSASEMLADPDTEGVSGFIKRHQDEEIAFELERGGVPVSVTAVPAEGIIPDQKAVGVSMEVIGTLKLPFHKALLEGLKTTWHVLAAIVSGIASLIGGALQGEDSLSQVSGPVGIAGLVGDASALGFTYLLSFTAFISLNLAVINLVPFPALDGGRILFVAIEAVRRKRMNPNVTNTANMIGFVLLLGLMVAVTFNDILRLV